MLVGPGARRFLNQYFGLPKKLLDSSSSADAYAFYCNQLRSAWLAYRSVLGELVKQASGPEADALQRHIRHAQTIDDFQGCCCEFSKVLFLHGVNIRSTGSGSSR